MKEKGTWREANCKLFLKRKAYSSNLVTSCSCRSCGNRCWGPSAEVAVICCVLLPGWGQQQYCQWWRLKSGAEFVGVTWKLPFFSALLLCQERGSTGGEAELMPPQAGWGGSPGMQHRHCHVPGACRSAAKGNCKSNSVANSWRLRSKPGNAEEQPESQMAPASQLHVFCLKTGLVLWSEGLCACLTAQHISHPTREENLNSFLLQQDKSLTFQRASQVPSSC